MAKIVRGGYTTLVPDVTGSAQSASTENGTGLVSTNMKVARGAFSAPKAWILIPGAVSSTSAFVSTMNKGLTKAVNRDTLCCLVHYAPFHDHPLAMFWLCGD